MKKQFIIGHLITLLISGLIYILFRSSSLLMFYWYNTLGIKNCLKNIRNYTIPLSNKSPEWIIFSLPDGLWIFSYVSFMLLIWKNTISKQSIFWILAIPIIAISSEIGQFLGLVIGTFDITDLILYILGVILPFIFFKKSINFKIQIL